MIRLVLLALFITATSLKFGKQDELLIMDEQPKCEKENFIMTYHLAGKTWVDSDGMHLAHSYDGHTWEPLYGTENRDPKFTSSTGFGKNLMFKPLAGRDRLLPSRIANGEHVLRDPFVIQDPRTEKFHALWTTGWASQTIGYASSDDLVTWSGQRELDVMKGHKDAINTWAPEAIYDDYKEEFVIFWSTAKGRTWEGPQDFHNSPFKLYYTTTKDFKKLAPPKQLFEPGHSTIDATMDKYGGQGQWKMYGGKYLLTYKNEDKKSLHLAVSDSPTGPFKKLNNVFSGAATEGPSMVEGKDGEWLLFHDTYVQGGYGVLSSRSAYGPWRDIAKAVNVPKNARHATVQKVTAKKMREVANALEKKNAGKWASPARMEKLKQMGCEL